jgi:phage shock protein A
MTIKNIKFSKVILLSSLVLFVALTAIPVLAQTTTATPTATATSRAAKAAANMQKMIQRSDTAITQRINSLNTLVTRVDAMQKLSDAEKSTLATSLQNEVTQLTTL